MCKILLYRFLIATLLQRMAFAQCVRLAFATIFMVKRCTAAIPNRGLVKNWHAQTKFIDFTIPCILPCEIFRYIFREKHWQAGTNEISLWVFRAPMITAASCCKQQWSSVSLCAVQHAHLGTLFRASTESGNSLVSVPRRDSSDWN